LAEMDWADIHKMVGGNLWGDLTWLDILTQLQI
jgi:hypothetical protein